MPKLPILTVGVCFTWIIGGQATQNLHSVARSGARCGAHIAYTSSNSLLLRTSKLAQSMGHWLPTIAGKSKLPLSLAALLGLSGNSFTKDSTAKITPLKEQWLLGEGTGGRKHCQCSNAKSGNYEGPQHTRCHRHKGG